MWRAILTRFVTTLIFAVGICAACSRSPTPRTEPYVVAYPTSWESIQLYGSEQSVVGFSSDLIYGIAREAGIQTRLVRAEEASFPSLLESGKVDAVITTEQSNPVNDQFYEFSVPYFVGGIVLVVPVSSPYATSNDLKNGEIAYDRGEGLDLALGVKTSWIFRPYENTTKALDAMLQGKVDGMVLHFIRATQLAKSLYRTKIKILMPPLAMRQIRLAVRKGKNHEFIELFDRGIQRYLKSGEYKELLEYWGIDSQFPFELSLKAN